MGKITKKDVDALKESGVLSKTAITEMENKGLVSKGRKSTTKRFMKTADGKFVTPFMYFRGGQNSTPSKKMEEFTTAYNKLLEKYTFTQTQTNK